MNISYGKGVSAFGPGVMIELSTTDVVRAIESYVVAQGVHIDGARTIRVDSRRFTSGSIYVDPSGYVITSEGLRMSGRGPQEVQHDVES